jgi:hypothetical protein
MSALLRIGTRRSQSDRRGCLHLRLAPSPGMRCMSVVLSETTPGSVV